MSVHLCRHAYIVAMARLHDLRATAGEPNALRDLAMPGPVIYYGLLESV